MAIISNAVTMADAGAFSVGLGAMVHIKTLTADGSGTALTFHHGTSNVVFNNTYPIYYFEFINIHPATDGADLVWQVNTVGASGFNENITSTFWDAYHSEGNAGKDLRNLTDYDQAQGTAYQFMTNAIGNDNDQNLNGSMYFFDPSSTVFTKHFMHTINTHTGDNYSENQFGAGYVNTTAAIDEIQFKINSGNFDAGQIKLYGIKDS